MGTDGVKVFKICHGSCMQNCVDPKTMDEQDITVALNIYLFHPKVKHTLSRWTFNLLAPEFYI